ncbi:hypothetical protein [Nocardioides jishulii]|uniref:Lipoprotein n=1 Tax=Nocardioides jishulii TaxID=2575440 RepID=A0A4U2YTN1_9ACTN|nr:hypothetical protein [Nocardioides jishulii]QCX28703.1 hypothetical protein FCL41_15055 [Nocardioides jishulii]TKI64404.1 hypothetical protein FC770_04520 [Nocardioides jishulii]
MRRRTSTLRPLLCAGLLSLTLLLAGCAEADPQPKFEKPAASPSVAGEETAEEFIERWNDEYNRLIAGEPNSWREMTASCDPCIQAADTVESYYEAGGGAKTEGRRIIAVKVGEPVQGQYLANVRIKSAPTTYREAADAPEKQLSGGTWTYDVTLTRDGREWNFITFVKRAQ